MSLAPSFSVPAGRSARPEEGMAAEVAAGLLRPGQKTLACKYLYDAVGSALFEAICALPEYGLTAADARLLQRHAVEIVAPFAPDLWIAELGSGSGQKTRWVLEQACRRAPVRYVPIEVSAAALQRCQRELAGIDGLRIQPLACEYLDGLQELARLRSSERHRGPLLVLFLGSSLGNFAPPEASAFLAAVRRFLEPEDGLLLGLDLVQGGEPGGRRLRPVEASPASRSPDPDSVRLLAAYDDAAGVTAAFNLNLLARLNRELGANFDLRHWRHEARYRRRQRRVEMHLRSRRQQQVRIPAAGITVNFRRGETIWTESSYKFRLPEIAALAAASGFRIERQWQDANWPFAETLCRCLRMPFGR